MAETECRPKPKIKEQISFFRETWMLIAGVTAVVGALVVFLITYGVVYPMVKSEITEYHEGFTREDATILKTDIGYIKRDMEKLNKTLDTILRLLLEGGNDIDLINLFFDDPGSAGYGQGGFAGSR